MNGGILTGPEILRQVEAGSIRVEPFKKEWINSGSYDLTLGKFVAVYTSVVIPDFTGDVPGERVRLREGSDLFSTFSAKPGINCLDAAQPNETAAWQLDRRGLLLRPGIGYLMHTAERVWTDKFVPVLDGKSSIGRLFTIVHVTAGYGDANFDGEYTLEVVVTHPVVVYPGMRLAQIRFHTMVGEVSLYNGNYQGDDAVGPIASKSYRQIEKDGLDIKKYR